ERLRLADSGADDDHVLHMIHSLEELRGGTLERREGRGWIRLRDGQPLIGAIPGALDQPELLDVARNRRLRRRKSALVQPPTKLLLTAQGIAIDEFQDDGLPTRFHEWVR